ncbi:MAG TPA: gamma-glutamyltransferase [Vicinamibacterales bacterium]|mgnify:CR=1 FL=1|nr:gamma-glutamyltransferase [Vicinamibacterales bacterium]HOQ60106.1 gamma-glutamyltransferase [Vicinamibacterales bacterium]
MIRRFALAVFVATAVAAVAATWSEPHRATRGMVVSEHAIASEIGVAVLKAGGNAVDAAVATAFALAVVHPAAGNIGGGGFLLYRPASGEPAAYDFRETAPAAASAAMFLTDGKYDAAKHHESYLSVGVPGTVAGLHLAWQERGTMPWRRLVEPAITLARDGFPLSESLAASLARVLPSMRRHPASMAQFSKSGSPYAPGDTLVQADLARTLERIAADGPAGFYEGETARLIEQDMAAHGGLISRADLKAYRPERRVPLRGTYRGYDIIAMPPVSSGGTALIEMLNVLEGFDLASYGWGSARHVHVAVEAMRRAYADRARHLGDPAFNPSMPIATLISKEYAASLRATIDLERASVSSPSSFDWPPESGETTTFCVVDAARNAVSLTYTLEAGYGSKIVVAGAGFLLNNEMGDFNAGPGLTDATGLVGTAPNLAAPGKRMLSSMTPTIVAKDGRLFAAAGALGGRTIINTVLQAVLNVIDFGMNAQEAIDAGRFHHQWLPDAVVVERHALSPDTLAILTSRGHAFRETGALSVAEMIVVAPKDGKLTAGVDARSVDGAAAGY